MRGIFARAGRVPNEGDPGCEGAVASSRTSTNPAQGFVIKRHVPREVRSIVVDEDFAQHGQSAVSEERALGQASAAGGPDIRMARPAHGVVY